MKVFLYLCLVMAFSASPAWAERESVAIPEEIKSFIPAGYRLIEVERADLNGDGTQDFLAVSQKPDTHDDMDENRESRTLQIITAQPDKTFTLAASSELAVYCAQCGGVFGDPFVEVEVAPKTFLISHYGGSSWRWRNNYKFNYSRIDKAWQLVKATKESFHVSEPDKLRTKVYTPKDFGKINLEDFDPQTYVAQEE